MAREASPRGVEAMREAAALCGQLSSRSDLVEQRDALWEEAASEGATYKQIADECGVAPSTVNLRLAKRRGSEWAQEV